MAVTPLHSARSVIRFGSRNLSGICLKRRSRCSRLLVLMSSLKSGRVAMAFVSSTAPADALGLIGHKVGNDRLAGDGALADRYERMNAARQIDIDAAAEADEADALSREQPVALVHEFYDAPRDQPGDLDDAELAAVVEHKRNRLALIVLARLVEIGIDEFSRNIGNARQCPFGRRPVHMNVEDVHENRDAGDRLPVEVEL